MSDRVLPAALAVAFGVLLACLLLVPYVAVAFHRRGTLGGGRAVLAFAALVYALALLGYVLLPLPPAVPDFCVHYGVGTQLHPFQFVADILRHGAHSPTELLGNSAALGAAFNVMLFVPFGGLLRHLSGRGITATTIAGFAVSLGVELTQLTGVWTLYPCAYRLFDVDDLLTNTTGALLGAVLVPRLLRLIPGQHTPADAQAPRPVTTGRRLLGMVCDLLATALTGAALSAAYRYLFLGGPMPADAVSRLLFWLLPALGQLALVWWTGATLGEHTVRLRPATPPGRLTARAALIRWSVGIGGFSLLQLPGTGATSLLALLLAVASLVAVVRTRRHRGLAYRAAHLDITDERQPPHDENRLPLALLARHNARQGEANAARSANS